MAWVYTFGVLLFLYLLPLLWATQECGNHAEKCPSSFQCGRLGKIGFPFTTPQCRDCGILAIHGCNDNNSDPKIILSNKGRPFEVITAPHYISPESFVFMIRDLDLHDRLRNKSCEAFSETYTLPFTSFPNLASFRIRNNGSLFRCNRTLHVRPPSGFFEFQCGGDFDILYGVSSKNSSNDDDERHRMWLLSELCSVIQFPIKDLPDTEDPFTFVTSEIFLQVRISEECVKCCHNRAGHCGLDSNNVFYCERDGKSRALKLGLGLGLGLVIVVLVILVIGCFTRRHYKRKYCTSGDQYETQDTYSDDPENGSIYYGVPLFTYKELQEATNNFDHTKALGDGGFGIVYYGKLRDGREVAVKRLYEHNFRRVEQFHNEVTILTNLRHKNLVSLYGCSTSRHHTSNQNNHLLLVYEYIPNGTLASHLDHFDHPNPPLTWHTRLRIAVDTASALAYLHASGIIHRDVKTANILLDGNLAVKVADFGLSRPVPGNVSHVSTAPQGTPGYVDPEYYQCYKLTSKSDVYSFGVVLMELVSSKPAVDMSRSDKEEVNLSSLAAKKMAEGEFWEVVDPLLGIEKDEEVKRMVVAVGELAVRCLNKDKEMRPTMEEVLEELKRIQNGGGDSAAELEEKVVAVVPPGSPNTVTDKWKSESTTPNVSG